ncbi:MULTISPECIES: TetR/AcrR family transcriptional regulator [Amycolatopsis]|uniref:TetR/AcrR family transcriptional regulator n=1 Tax=Amycolatopsis TaxID=1813 RepID=UPI000412FD9C|nr:TetR/AcrR family transcriptional regulator [Amycolatopsis thermoflava]
MPEEATRQGGARQARREQTRSRLAEAAVDCFSLTGYVATSIEDITAAAGTTRATFYRHFKSKADVVMEVLRHLDEQYEPVYTALAELAEEPTRERIAQWLDTTLRVWERTRIASAAVTEAALLEDPVRERQQTSFERDIDMLSTALQKGGRWNPEQAKARAVLLFGQLQQMFLRWSLHGWDVDRGEILEVLTRMWSAALETD